MGPIRKKARDFLKGYRMDFEDIDMEEYVAVFLSEMEKGLAGSGSSLQMIPTYIDIEGEIPLTRPVIVLDAGGTNFRAASVHFERKGRPVIEHLSLYPMPGLEKEVLKTEFFRTVAGYVRDTAGLSDRIGFCFSYPTEILPTRDGRLLRFVKEVKAKEVEGELVGENLLAALSSMGLNGVKRVVLLNDTVATLLAGRAAFTDRVFSSYVGFILGTGTNCCYIEKNSNITKKKDLDPGKNQVINVESGGFGRGPRGVIDLEFDRDTIDPGVHTFEKMISGAYIGALCLRVIQRAAQDGLFSKTLVEELKAVASLPAKDLSDFLYNPTAGRNTLSAASAKGTDDDRTFLWHLIDRIIERAAKLTAVNISSVILKSGKGVDPCIPVCATAEGSVFYGLKALKEKVEYYMKAYLADGRERFFEFVKVENATLIGAAIAGLTN